MINTFLLAELENLLGKSRKSSKDNYAFKCPFCDHPKKKLEVDLNTTKEGHNNFACWVCGTKGRTIKSLLYQMKVPNEEAHSILKYVKKGTGYSLENTESKILTLPKEFKALWEVSSESVLGKKVKGYLYKRGLTDYDIFRYNIGYCTSGEYNNRIIIPSYNADNKLNFFVARSYENSFFSYKNPSFSKKDIVFFENQINWDLPVVLVEGVFDAIAVRRNAIPLLGKRVPQTLFDKIVLNRVKEVVIALDQDAKKGAIDTAKKFLDANITTYFLDLPDKDPSSIGFEKINKLISSSQQINEGDIIKLKLSL